MLLKKKHVWHEDEMRGGENKFHKTIRYTDAVAIVAIDAFTQFGVRCSAFAVRSFVRFDFDCC